MPAATSEPSHSLNSSVEIPVHWGFGVPTENKTELLKYATVDKTYHYLVWEGYNKPAGSLASAQV